MRDVAFYFRKKTGFPKITDSGLADVVLGGQGLTAVVHLVSADKDKRCVPFLRHSFPLLAIFYPTRPIFPFLPVNTTNHNAFASCTTLYFFNSCSLQDPSSSLQSRLLHPRSPSLAISLLLWIDADIVLLSHSSVFKVKNVHVKLDSLKFSIRDSKHDTLYKTLKPLATGLVKRQIQKAVEDAITTGMEYVDGQLVGVRDRMHEASARPDTNRTQALQELFQRKKEETADVTSKASSKTNSQFKVVSKRDSALLPGTGHPAGWVNRVQDRQDAVQVGDGWKSEAFNVV